MGRRTKNRQIGKSDREAKTGSPEPPVKVSVATVRSPEDHPQALPSQEAPLLPPAVEQWLQKQGAAVGIALFLVAATLAVYGQTLGFEFVSYDDGAYVYENRHVKDGFSLATLEWAFAGVHSSNWHPLTTLTHILDWSLYGNWAGGHHLTNVLFHAAGSVVLFLALRRLTGATWRSGLVAALFCLHPAHVESVAWVSERKDVLSGLFFGLTLWAYAAYAQQTFSWARYLLVVALFALGLLCKPMLVTLPFVLLLLDFWPLNRFGSTPRATLILEKLPMIVLSGVSCVITYAAQSMTGAISITSAPIIPLQTAILGYSRYLAMLVWPFRLTFRYPRDREVYVAATIVCGVALAVVTWVLLRWCRDRQRYLLVGWLWFLGMIVPVSGIVPVGDESVADRYSYLTYTGLFAAMVWLAADALGAIGSNRNCVEASRGHRRPGEEETVQSRSLTTSARRWGFAIAGPVLVFCGARSIQQARCWRDSEALYRQSLAVMPENFVAHSNLGKVLENRGKLDEAEAEFRLALEIEPRDFQAHNGLGVMERRRGNVSAAIEHYLAALQEKPDFALAHNNLAVAYHDAGRIAEAKQECLLALRYDPDLVDAERNLGNALAGDNKWQQAIAHFRRAVELEPNRAEDHFNLGVALCAIESYGEGIAELKTAVELDRDNVTAHQELANQLYLSGKLDEALREWVEVLKRSPGERRAAKGVGMVFVKARRGAEAIPFLQLALSADPQDIEARSFKADAHALAGQAPEATAEYREILRRDPKNVRAGKALATLLLRTGHGADAVVVLRAALAAAPEDIEARQFLVLALLAARQAPPAMAEFRKILQRDAKNQQVLNGLAQIAAEHPKDVFFRGFRAFALLEVKQTEAGMTEFREVLKLDPKNQGALNSLAWIEAAHPRAKLRNGEEAVVFAERAAELRKDDPPTLDTLAAAYAEAGRFKEAVDTARKAKLAAEAAKNKALADAIAARLKLYEAGKPFRDETMAN